MKLLFEIISVKSPWKTEESQISRSNLKIPKKGNEITLGRCTASSRQLQGQFAFRPTLSTGRILRFYAIIRSLQDFYTSIVRRELTETD